MLLLHGLGRAETKQRLGKSPGSSRGVNLEISWGGVGKAEEEGAAETMLGDIWCLVSKAQAIFWPNASFWQRTLISWGLYRKVRGLRGRVQGKARHRWKSPPSPVLRRAAEKPVYCLINVSAYNKSHFMAQGCN